MGYGPEKEEEEENITRTIWNDNLFTLFLRESATNKGEMGERSRPPVAERSRRPEAARKLRAAEYFAAGAETGVI